MFAYLLLCSFTNDGQTLIGIATGSPIDVFQYFFFDFIISMTFFQIAWLSLFLAVTSVSSFTIVPSPYTTATTNTNTITATILSKPCSGCFRTKQLHGYLDDLSSELNEADPNTDVEATSREATNYDKSKVDRYGPGDFSQFVDFNEFDGGDGRTFLEH